MSFESRVRLEGMDLMNQNVWAIIIWLRLYSSSASANLLKNQTMSLESTAYYAALKNTLI